MAKQVKLAARTRNEAGRTGVKKIKAAGMIPAVVYGGNQKAQSLQVSGRDIKNLLQHAVGEHILVDLEVEDAGAKTSRLAIIKEIQHHPLGGGVLHVDFHAISANEKIEAEIPIETLGEATGVKNFGGILEQSVRALNIECLPRDLPESIVVDVSNLNIGDQITVADIKLAEGVRALNDPGQVVFVVAEPTVIEEEPVAAEAAPEGPEVIREKKEEGAAEKPEKAEKGQKGEKAEK